jgi:hypothetical protein
MLTWVFRLAGTDQNMQDLKDLMIYQELQKYKNMKHFTDHQFLQK